MRKNLVGAICASLLLSIVLAYPHAAPQMLAGHGFAVRNDGATPVTLEYHVGDTWKQVLLPVGKDTTLIGDRMRVSTSRPDDGATITVELPVQPAKRYRLIPNPQAGFWDFSRSE